MKKNANKFLKFITLISGFLILQDQIVALIGKIGILIDFESGSFKIGFIILCLIISVFYMGLISRNYISNKNVNFGIILFFFCYVIYRISSWNDYGHFNKLIYSDILSVQIVLFHIVLVNIRSINKIALDSNQNNFFLEDSIYEGVIDNELVLDKLIQETSGFTPANSFSVGLNASWGYGKTTFLNRYKYKFEKQNPEAIIFWYRIWKNKGTDGIIDNFFNELDSKLKPYSGEISNEISGYVKAILDLSPSEIGKLFESGMNIFQSNKSLEDHYLRINNAIKKIDRQVIILLDDLDRLESKEILDTYKIIRTLSDFNNIIFIAGYDREYLQKTLGNGKENYINKIFQVELNLIPFDEQRIMDLLIEEIKKSSSQEELKGLNSELVQAFYKLFSKSKLKLGFNLTDSSIDFNDESSKKEKLNYKLYLSTYRDIKRFVNEFKFNYSFIDSTKDINLKEYLLLKLLVFKYRGLQNILFINLNKYLSKKTLDKVNYKLQDSFGFDITPDTYLYDNIAETNIKDILKKEFSGADIDVIDRTLRALFGEKSIKYYESNQNSIARIYHTNTYIRNDIAGAIYKLSDFSKFLKDSKLNELIEKIYTFSDQTSNQVLHELKLFLLNEKLTSGKKFRNIFSGLNLISPNILINDMQEVITLLNTAFITVFKKDKHKFILNLKKVINLEFLGYFDFFLSDLSLNEARKERNDIYNENNASFYKDLSLTNEDIKIILLFKFQTILAKSLDFKACVQTYHLFTDFIALEHQIVRSNEANKLFQDHIRDNFIHYFLIGFFDFVETSNETSPFDFREYKPNDFLFQIFSNTDDLNNLKENPVSSKLFKKFRDDGLTNYSEYLDSVKEVDQMGIYGKDRLGKIKLLLKTFKDNGFVALSYKEYTKNWNKIVKTN